MEDVHDFDDIDALALKGRRLVFKAFDDSEKNVECMEDGANKKRDFEDFFCRLKSCTLQTQKFILRQNLS